MMRTVTDTDPKNVVVVSYYPDQAWNSYSSDDIARLQAALEELHKAIIALKPVK
jgi:hypothetical protein